VVIGELSTLKTVAPDNNQKHQKYEYKLYTDFSLIFDEILKHLFPIVTKKNCVAPQ
jgi:hypothetical protein